jgi:hypothetical protein
MQTNVVDIASRRPITPIDPQRPKRNVVAFMRLCVEGFGWLMLFGLCVAAVS